jgi:hypothetical protein
MCCSDRCIAYTDESITRQKVKYLHDPEKFMGPFYCNVSITKLYENIRNEQQLRDSKACALTESGIQFYCQEATMRRE